MKRATKVAAGAVVACGVVAGATLLSTERSTGAPKEARPAAKPSAKKTNYVPPLKRATNVKAKPLSSNVKEGLQWLVAQQQDNGGWGQGEESTHMRGGVSRAPMGKTRGDAMPEAPVSNSNTDPATVADTSMAAMALIRAGSTPTSGPHAKNIQRAVAFVCGEIEKSEPKVLWVTSQRGTRLQSKLGSYVDTFMASMLLAEVRGHMQDSASEKRVKTAYDKVMDKIEKNQKQDGTWDNSGWAPTLNQSIASKALNRAAQKGLRVDESVRARTEKYARGQFDEKSGKFSADGSAGVPLYSSAANLGAMQDSDNTNRQAESKARAVLARPNAAPAARADAQKTLKRVEENRFALQKAQAATVKNLESAEFVAGFGSNGGEEFLSHMNIGESLVVKGGPEWAKWDKAMTENMNRIQNSDGSWSGHHCITGKTFCTAAALMVLTVDRAPVPVADQIKRRA